MLSICLTIAHPLSSPCDSEIASVNCIVMIYYSRDNPVKESHILSQLQIRVKSVLV